MNELTRPRAYLTDSYDQFADAVTAYFPSLLTALLLVLAGLLLANLLRWIILRLGTGFDHLVQRTRLGASMRLKWPLSSVLAGATYWLVLIVFFTAAAEALGLPGFSESLDTLIKYIPDLLLATLIVVGGLLLGGVVRDHVINGATAARLAHAEMLGTLARGLIVMLTVLIGLEQVGLDLRLAEYLILIMMGAIFGALALGFGLGAGPTVTNIIAIRNVRRHYRVGQGVRVGDVEGTILEMSSAFVVLDTTNGRTLVPARVFEEQVSVLLEPGDGDDG